MANRALIVEDDEQMRALLERGLRDEGYEVVAVGNGVDALIALAAETFSVAAVDVMLPEMSGLEVCRHIRARGSSLPILLLTARDSVDDRVRGLDSGADDYLIKPFAFAELSARLRALVRRDTAPPKALIHVGDLDLDTATLRAHTATASLSLSGKEFTLLRLFATHPGEAISRARILDEVWATTHIDPNVVDQYVGYLRRKLDGAGARIRIVTLRGVGYRLEVDET